MSTLIKHNYNERTFNYHDINVNDNTNLHGYLQSEKYFKHCEDVIRKHFEPSEKIKKEMKLIFDSTKDYCAVHVRRGDYVKLSATHHPLQTLEYYNKAMSMIRKTNPGILFIVFSDELSWCKENLKGSDINYSWEYGNPVHIYDFFCMASFKHNIIANSSFSWWAAWLNKNPDKRVIAPLNWFGPALPENHDKDIVPEGWERI